MTFDIGSGGVSVEVVQCRQAEHESHRHRLAVVEFCVRGPPRVVDMGFVPVGDVGADRGGYAHYRHKDGADAGHVVRVGRDRGLLMGLQGVCLRQVGMLVLRKFLCARRGSNERRYS